MEMMDKISELEQRIESLETATGSQSELIETQAEAIDLLSEQNSLLTKSGAQKDEIISKQGELIKFYEEQFALSQRRQFGSSSEQTPDQLRFENLFNEPEDQADPSLTEPTIEEITYKRKRQKGKRKEDLSALPVERTDYELPESERVCPECGEVMGDIGVTVRNELEIIPAKVINREHAVHAYGCAKCEKDGKKRQIIKADAPPPLISGSLASPSAVAHIATQKYVNGIPLYRTEKVLGYDGVTLSRQTMANWLIYCTQNYLVGIYSLMRMKLLEETVLHADETSVQVLQEPGRAAKTKVI